MRYDTTVIFKNDNAVFDTSIGDLVDVKSEPVTRLCAVADLATSRQVEILGRVNNRALAVHYRGRLIPAKSLEVLSGPYKGRYTVVSFKSFRNKQALVVEAIK